MRHIGLLSVLSPVLFLGVSSSVSAQNYVPQQNYNGPSIIVNMDVLQDAYPVPTRQPMAQPLPPLRPPMLKRPTPMQQAPVAQYQPPRAMPPIMDAPVAPLPPVMMPEQIAEPRKPISAPTQLVPPQPFSTRELAASAPPRIEAPSPIAKAPEPVKEAPKKIAKVEPVKQEVLWDKPAEKVASIAKPIVASPKLVEKIAEAPVKKQSVDEFTANVKTPDVNNPARQLLAQARDKAESQGVAQEKRQVVLFDDMPAVPAPKAKEKTQQIAALPAPVEKLSEPVIASPVAMPSPISPLAAKPVDSKPGNLPNVAPAAIPNNTAMKNAATKVDDFEAYRLLFDANSSELKPSETKVLDDVIAKLQKDDAAKLQLRAYANGTPDSVAQARRLSLTRALAVRSYIVQKGLSASRMDVRALGTGSTAMNDAVGRGAIPADRVDMIFVR